MKTGTKRAVAAFLVWVQMLVLLTAAGPQIRAADDAARAYLDRTIASDPNNTCHRCGF